MYLGIVIVPLKSELSSSNFDMCMVSSTAFIDSSVYCSANISSPGKFKAHEGGKLFVVEFSGNLTLMSLIKRSLTACLLLKIKLFNLSTL